MEGPARTGRCAIDWPCAHVAGSLLKSKKNEQIASVVRRPRFGAEIYVPTTAATAGTDEFLGLRCCATLHAIHP
ncbi:hypothetical protein E2562_021164 [Oryza meyeriana var. granulata]|uniref:Uncharacterized protein n=1 Tax=Oryza meyeriana var. granulata TaxID=110450 RepID=A0A6G1DXQ9_9ORYZ|nr:hypothetical protein E2562_021164 [Oryza meyeriana var. granulata]